jgi:methyl-accepting chemotaxis protein
MTTTSNPTTDTIFSWKIDNLEIISNHESLKDVVKSVHYTYTGVYENYSGQISGTVGLDPPNALNYIPYQDLTQEQVISWLHAKYDISLFNKNIIEQIQTQIPAPPVTTIFGLPWASVQVDGNTTDVSGNTTDVSGNTTDVSGNTTDVSGNTTDVSGNTTDVSGNTTDVNDNTTI